MFKPSRFKRSIPQNKRRIKYQTQCSCGAIVDLVRHWSGADNLSMHCYQCDKKAVLRIQTDNIMETEE